MNPRDKLKRLTHLFMKKLRQGRLLEIVVPRISQLDLVGIIEVDEDSDEVDTIIRKSLLSSETSKCYAQLMAIAGLVAEQLYCKSLLGNIAYWYPSRNSRLDTYSCLDFQLAGPHRREMFITVSSIFSRIRLSAINVY